jgi:hypothetical protein
LRSAALKYLPITPDTYWRLTSSELSDMLRGAIYRREQDRELAAWVTAHLMNVAGKVVKKKITADHLLGRKRRGPITFEDKVASFDEIMRRASDMSTDGEGDDG